MAQPRSKTGNDTRYQTLSMLHDVDLDKSTGASTYESSALAPLSAHPLSVGHVRATDSDGPVNQSWLGTTLMQTASVLWLIPMAALLWLNFSNHVIGQSAWCPYDFCNKGGNGTSNQPYVSARERLEYDRQDHNLLGWLQLVAKALEMWFALIAVWLTYLLMLRWASHEEGLPIEYLTRQTRMAQALSNFKPRVWAPLVSSEAGAGRRRLWPFFLATLILSILSLLMGPATAVLVLPTQQWITTPTWFSDRLDGWNYAPTLDSDYLSQVSNCSDGDIAAKRWSCSYGEAGRFFDYWYLWSASNGTGFGTWNYWFEAYGFAFEVNSTTANNDIAAQNPIWVPNRMMMKQFLDDFRYFQDVLTSQPATDGNATLLRDFLPTARLDQYEALRKALRLEAQRNGPILGYIHNTLLPTTSTYNTSFPGVPHVGLPTSTIVDEKRSVRCYPNWQYISGGEFFGSPGLNQSYTTRCIQTGDWDTPYTSVETFAISQPWNQTFDPASASNNSADLPAAIFTIYSSDRVAILPNGALPSGFGTDCLAKNNTPGCDWDAFFTADPTSPWFNLTRYALTVEMEIPSTGQIQAIWDFIVFANTTEYSFDPTVSTNPYSIVQTQDLPLSGTPIPVDPNWLLLTLAVDANGTIPAIRSTSLLLLSNPDPLPDWETTYGIATNLPQAAFPYMLTLMEYNTTFTPSQSDPQTLASNATADSLGLEALGLRTRYYTWAYSINGRSSQFGAAVVLLGVIVVFFYIVMASFDRREHHSITDILASALEHYPQDEFADTHGNEKKISMTRFRMVEDRSVAGKFVFESPKRQPKTVA